MSKKDLKSITFSSKIDLKVKVQVKDAKYIEWILNVWSTANMLGNVKFGSYLFLNNLIQFTAGIGELVGNQTANQLKV